MLELYEKEDSEIRFLIHPGLMKLYFYDQEKNTDFMTTLREYLTQPGQPAKIAENLHIHKNTLQYRISKLKETTGLDVRKPTESPALYLAYSIAEELISENYDLSLLLRGTK